MSACEARSGDTAESTAAGPSAMRMLQQEQWMRVARGDAISGGDSDGDAAEEEIITGGGSEEGGGTARGRRPLGTRTAAERLLLAGRSTFPGTSRPSSSWGRSCGSDRCRCGGRQSCGSRSSAPRPCTCGPSPQRIRQYAERFACSRMLRSRQALLVRSGLIRCCAAPSDAWQREGARSQLAERRRMPTRRSRRSGSIASR